LAGLGSIQNVLTVGKSGAGAQFTTVQAALDTIPSTSSPTNPYIVLIGPGVYQETINIVRDGVTLRGLGAVLQSEQEGTPDGPGAYHTVTIQAALGTTPTQIHFEDLTITNTHTNRACVRVSGGVLSDVGASGIHLVNCTLVANSAAGNRTLWCTAVNNVTVQGGSMEDPHGLGLILVEECAEVTLTGLRHIPAMSFRWDALQILPLVLHTGYFVSDCGPVNTSLVPDVSFTSSLAPDEGFLSLSDLTLGVVTQAGGELTVRGCAITDLSNANGVLNLVHSDPKVSLATSGTGTVSGATLQGVAGFVGDTSVTVTLDATWDSANYVVLFSLDGPSVTGGPWVANKTVSGFDIVFNGAETLNVSWMAHQN